MTSRGSSYICTKIDKVVTRSEKDKGRQVR